MSLDLHKPVGSSVIIIFFEYPRKFRKCSYDTKKNISSEFHKEGQTKIIQIGRNRNRWPP